MPVTSTGTTPPVAARRPVVREAFGERRSDPWAWLADPDDPEVVAHLEAENRHTDEVLGPLAASAERIAAEIRRRTQETRTSIAHRKEAWWYHSRTEEGLAYPVWCRRPDDGTGLGPLADDRDGAETVLLDENAMAKGRDHFALHAAEVAPGGDLLAVATDTTGDERATLSVRDLRTGDWLDLAIEGAAGDLAWSADAGTLWYSVLDERHRPHQVRRHHLGSAPDGSEDAVIHTEGDRRFFCGVGTSRSGDYVAVIAQSRTTTELWIGDATEPEQPLAPVGGRTPGVEHTVAHAGDGLWLASNAGAPEGALWRGDPAAVLSAGPVGPHDETSPWQPVVGHDPDVRIEGIDAFARHLVLVLRRGGRPDLDVLTLAGPSPVDDDPDTGPITNRRTIEVTDQVRSLGPNVNEAFDSTRYRFTHESPVTPPTIVEEDLDTGDRRQLDQRPVPGVDLSDYVTSRSWAPAGDGRSVPVSLAHHRSVSPDGSAPALVEGYGAYEMSIDPWFSVSRLSLLDRGVVWSFAHVRGGGELGRRWYDEGHGPAKPNSFTDLGDACDHLLSEGWADRDRLGVRGGSAGGLLVGAAINRDPARFRVVVADVPFVDVLTTMSNPELPLTAIETEEWGDPITDEAAYHLIRSYSPTDNVVPAAYPAVLATAGVNDPRVGFDEPTKWVQALRAATTSGPDRPILLWVEGAGHAGPSGRYAAWAHEARILAFICDQLGVEVVPEDPGAEASPASGDSDQPMP